MTFSGWYTTMKDINRLCVCVLLIVCIVLLTACTQERVLASTDAVEIVRNGRQTSVTDRETGKTYKLYTRRAKRGESPDRPVTVADTGNFRLVLVEDGYIVEAGGEVYQFTRKRGMLYAEKGD